MASEDEYDVEQEDDNMNLEAQQDTNSTAPDYDKTFDDES